MRFLGHEVVSAVIFKHRKTRNAGTRRGKWVEPRAIAEHVAEVQSVAGGKIMVDSDTELICAIPQSIGGVEYVRAVIRLRKQIQESLRNPLDRVRSVRGQLIEWDGIGLGSRRD